MVPLTAPVTVGGVAVAVLGDAVVAEPASPGSTPPAGTSFKPTPTEPTPTEPTEPATGPDTDAAVLGVRFVNSGPAAGPAPTGTAPTPVQQVSASRTPAGSGATTMASTVAGGLPRSGMEPALLLGLVAWLMVVGSALRRVPSRRGVDRD